MVVRGSRKGRQYSLVVDDRAVIGKRSDNDCVLAEETGIDAVQFELIHEGGDLYIENLSNKTPTLIGGHPLTTKLRLTSDTLVGTGETVLRMVRMDELSVDGFLNGAEFDTADIADAEVTVEVELAHGARAPRSRL